MAKETQSLIVVINAIIWEARDQDVIIPSWIATEAMKKLHGMFLRDKNPEIFLAAHLQFRQVAREICRKTFMEEEKDSGVQYLFESLQWRYPKAHSEARKEGEYVLLDKMTSEDVEYNVARLRAEGQAKLKHADALEAWNANRGGRRAA